MQKAKGEKTQHLSQLMRIHRDQPHVSKNKKTALSIIKSPSSLKPKEAKWNGEGGASLPRIRLRNGDSTRDTREEGDAERQSASLVLSPPMRSRSPGGGRRNSSDKIRQARARRCGRERALTEGDAETAWISADTCDKEQTQQQIASATPTKASHHKCVCVGGVVLTILYVSKR